MGDNIITGITTSNAAPQGLTFDADGKVWVYAVAHGALTAKTPYLVVVNEFGSVTLALGVARGYVGVPEKAVDSGALAKLQVGGDVDDMVTASLSVSVGHALTITSGAVADAGADYTGAVREFCVCRTVSTTSTTQDVKLVPDKITAS